ncbi:sperm flagellar protein 1-like [Teleopsis dalmanni]|uniref:sperm flagellar protein 1-like n=1 Tax=Teleopsis dalmanni TaxID=139649 RepID=UPI0018CF7ADB|nr:sperm flagellar protein 1-like [Teleopsis dalmanni]
MSIRSSEQIYWNQKIKPLTKYELNELLDWLKDHKITFQKLNRDFSDSVLMAILLKQIIPKKIDVHNYSKCNGVKSKLYNWKTMNTKVFTKIQMTLSNVLMEKLAKSVPGVIEILLTQVMLFERGKLANKIKSACGDMNWNEDKDVIIVSVNKKIGKTITQVPQKMIRYALFEEAKDYLTANRKILKIAHNKIARIEKMLELRNKRIDDLIKEIHLMSNHEENI